MQLNMALLLVLQEEMRKMLMHFKPFSSLLLLLFLSTIFLLYKLTRNHDHKLKLLPSPSRLPIIGNLHQIGKFPHRSLRALSDKYGPLMLVYYGSSPTLVVSSADTAREVLKSHDLHFANRPRTTGADIFLYGCQDIGFAPYGDYWRNIKKLSVLELLSNKRVRAFQFVRDEEVAILVNKIRRLCLNGSSINLSEMIMNLSNNIISRCVLGVRAEAEGGDNKFGHLSRKIMIQFVALCFRDSFPLLGWLDHVTGLISQMKATKGEVDAFFDQVIEEHRASGCDDETKTDFMHIILQLEKNGMLEVQLTRDNLKAILMDMFIGGTETSATTMEWIMTELVKNQSAMNKVQEEVRRVMGKKTKIELDDIAKMTYMKHVISETFRLHPPLPLLLPRESTTNLELRGYTIPPKTKVMVNVFAIHRDPKLWDRPNEFLPERFENNPVDFKGQDFQLIPFGSGRRSCPGITFGVATVEFSIVNLLHWFDWKLADGSAAENLDMAETYGITVFRKNPLCLIPSLHNQL